MTDIDARVNFFAPSLGIGHITAQDAIQAVTADYCSFDECRRRDDGEGDCAHKAQLYQAIADNCIYVDVCSGAASVQCARCDEFGKLDESAHPSLPDGDAYRERRKAEFGF